MLLHGPTRRVADALTRSRARRRTRGQSLVEFALVLPIMLLLVLIVLDFGRVYLGYINLQNEARIAANYAADNPDSWTAPLSATAVTNQAAYKNKIINDTKATNCALPIVAGVTTVPTPVFTDQGGTGRPMTWATRSPCRSAATSG